jgi:cyclic pyranopterin phosphate synthase
VSEGRFPHLSAAGDARMAGWRAAGGGVGGPRPPGRVLLSAECVAALRDGTVPKGDALAVARIAGIQGAKKAPDLIPLCHPLFISGVDVSVELTDEGVEITATVKTTERTGVEMEALTAVAVAGLAVIDMIKAIDRDAVISDVRVLSKSGGRRGDWTREDES